MATPRAEAFEQEYDRADPGFRSELDQEFAVTWNEFHAKTTSLSSVEKLPFDFGYRWDDPVHGIVNLPEGVVQDIYEHPVFQRLWEVQQFGDRWAVSQMLRSKPHSRGEHSLGTWSLLDAHFGDDCPPALTVAALLHDAGHPVFSHHGEATFDDSTAQRWHEGQLDAILHKDHFGINALLLKHHIEVAEVVAYLEHPLLDSSLPDLCADRIDYIFRDAVAGRLIHEKLARECLADLRADTETGQWYFTNPGAALLTQQLMVILNAGTYMSPAMRYIKEKTAALLRHGLSSGHLSVADVAEGTDDGVLEKLWNSDGIDPTLDHLLTDLYEPGMSRTTPHHIGYFLDDVMIEEPRFNEFDFRTTKRRAVDPLCQNPDREAIDGKTIRRLSEWVADGYNPHRDSPHYAQHAGLIPDNSSWPMMEERKIFMEALQQRISIKEAAGVVQKREELWKKREETLPHIMQSLENS